MLKTSNSRLKFKNTKPRAKHASRAANIRRRTNPNLYDNYSDLLKLYVFSKNEAAQKKQVKVGKNVLKFQRPNDEMTSSRLKAISGSLRLLILRSKLVASRVSSAIEISYQSIYK